MGRLDVNIERSYTGTGMGRTRLRLSSASMSRGEARATPDAEYTIVEVKVL